jgi:hypothetical protein
VTKTYDISIFDWPDRFFVETEEPDRELIELFDDHGLYPYMVDLGDAGDLGEHPDGYCDCRDFRFNVRPNLGLATGRKTCCHIDACRRFRDKFSGRPKQLPATVNF